MALSQFLADHTFATAMVVILLFLIWRFGIQPRLGLTNNEIEEKITDTIDEVVDNISIGEQDLFDDTFTTKT